MTTEQIAEETEVTPEVTPEVAPDVEATPEVAPEPQTRREAIEQAFDRPRDDQGRFVKDQEKTEEPEKTETVEEKIARAFPSGWKKDYEPLYRQLEADEQYVPFLDEIDRREKDILEGISSYKSKADYADKISSVLEPYQANIHAMGAPPEEVISRLMAADHRLRYGNAQEKVYLLAHLAQEYGIDLNNLQEIAEQQSNIDPAIAQLQAEINSLKQEREQTVVRDQQGLLSAAETAVEQFKVNAEHFEAVRGDMAAILQSSAQAGRDMTLEQAYEQALWMNPETREKLLAAQREKEEADRKERAAKAAEEAKRAAVSVKGAPAPGSSSAATPKDRRSFLEQQFVDRGL